MADSANRVIPVAIEDEVKEAYLNYAMSVIVSRALPDVRDGMKPVHRRLLFAMNEMGLRSDRPFKKAGRIVGDVLGKYHPHGDQSIYDTLVRLAQDFSLRYPAVDGQGNFGSLDGDPAAAMRYTEARLTKVAEEMLRDIKKDTVDFGPNYDDSMREPLVLPGAFPFLLANGASGIAVGMATNIPSHNVREVCQAVVAHIDKPNVSIDLLAQMIHGPDFPTGGIIYGRKGITEIYHTGRGRIAVRARVTLETAKSGREQIVVTEIPYAVNKAALIVRIADLVKDRRIEGIADLNDESGRDGLRIVIELRRNSVPKIVLNQLFTHTQLQVHFAANCLALVNGTPRTLNLKEMISCFVDHRKVVVTRRTEHDLRRAEERAHILEGLRVALANIDEVIAIIKSSRTVDTARGNLMKRFKLTERQAQAILDMRLQKLTNLETKKILEELAEVLAQIKYLKGLLSSEEKILGVVKAETLEIAKSYGDERRTEVVDEEVEEIDIEDLIAREDMIILISNRGLMKRMPVSAYRRQNRGGRGVSYASLRDNDFVEQLFIASTHDPIVFMTSAGRAYWIKVHEIPEGSRSARGQSIKALLAMSNDEETAAVVSLTAFAEGCYIIMATSRGVIKKVRANEFVNAKTRGVIALNLSQGDRLVSAAVTQGEDDVVLVTRKGFALRLKESTVRAMGRAAQGVRGIKLSADDEVAGVVVVSKKERVLVVSQKGYGKMMDYGQLAVHGRGTQGQICYRSSEKLGEIAGVLSVEKGDDLICITSQGTALKTRLRGIPVQGKQAGGVKIVNIKAPDIVVGLARATKGEA